MIDGKTDPEIIYQKLKTALNQWCLGRKIIFFCFAGISRSNGMATTLIAYYQNIDWTYVFSLSTYKPFSVGKWIDLNRGKYSSLLIGNKT
jgi:predicted protein tyrosine phosphatase